MSRVTDTLNSLAACLQAQIEERGLMPPCFLGVIPGDSAGDDYMGDDCKPGDDQCGSAWVRLATFYPSTGIGLLSVQPGSCSQGWSFDVEIGIARCFDMDQMPDEAMAAELAELQTNDMLAMVAAVKCCFDSDEYIVQPYIPLPMLGGVFGGSFTVIVGLT